MSSRLQDSETSPASGSHGVCVLSEAASLTLLFIVLLLLACHGAVRREGPEWLKVSLQHGGVFCRNMLYHLSVMNVWEKQHRTAGGRNMAWKCCLMFLTGQDMQGALLKTRRRVDSESYSSPRMYFCLTFTSMALPEINTNKRAKHFTDIIKT